MFFENYVSQYGTVFENFPNDEDILANLGWIGSDYPEYIEEELYNYFNSPIFGTNILKINCMNRPETKLSINENGTVTRASVAFDLEVFTIDHEDTKWRLLVGFDCFGVLNDEHCYDLASKILVVKKDKMITLKID